MSLYSLSNIQFAKVFHRLSVLLLLLECLLLERRWSIIIDVMEWSLFNLLLLHLGLRRWDIWTNDAHYVFSLILSRRIPIMLSLNMRHHFLFNFILLVFLHDSNSLLWSFCNYLFGIKTFTWLSLSSKSTTIKTLVERFMILRNSQFSLWVCFVSKTSRIELLMLSRKTLVSRLLNSAILCIKDVWQTWVIAILIAISSLVFLFGV